MANQAQVALLLSLFSKLQMFKTQEQLDWLYSEGMDVDKLEDLQNSEVTLAKNLLETKIRNE